MRHKVLVWDNQGARSVEEFDTVQEARAAAKQARTLDNRTVKIADHWGTTNHWARSVHLGRNHWSAIAVADGGYI